MCICLNTGEGDLHILLNFYDDLVVFKSHCNCLTSAGNPRIQFRRSVQVSKINKEQVSKIDKG